MRYLFLLAAVVLLQEGALTAQTPCCPYIDSIQISPATPTDQDTVMIMTRSTTPCLGHRIYYAHSVVNDTIYLDGCFFSGLLTAIQSFYDTTRVGPLPAGTWHIHYTGRISNDVSRCEMQQYQTMATTFTVTGTSTATNHSGAAKTSWHLFPNPTDGLITLHSPASKSEKLSWSLYDVNGRCLMSVAETDIKTILDLSSLSPGIYLFRGITTEETVNVKVVRR